jgi:hypothetical protein
MIKEWLAEDGRIVRFDDTDQSIDFRNGLNEIVEGPRPATPEEVADYRIRFPISTAEELQKRAAVSLALDQLIGALRAANTDGQITSSEFAQGGGAAVAGFTKFVGHGKPDDAELNWKAIVALINLTQAITFITQDINSGVYAALTQVADIRTDLDDLISRLEAANVI